MIKTGFNYFCYGNVHPCWMDSGILKYRLRSGLVIEHKTGFEDLTIEEQTNLFISDRVMWILYHNGFQYIGRRDGSVSIYRVSDDVLYGANSWHPPYYPETSVCGFKTGDYGCVEVHIDMRDKRTVYATGVYEEGVLPKPTDLTLNMTALRGASMTHYGNTQHIISKGGDVIEVDEWFVQEGIRRRDCPCFL